MKLSRQASSVGGYFLIEVLIYIGVVAVVMGVAFGAFYRCLDNSRDLHRNGEDILRVLEAGELWRADIRAATGPPRILSGGSLVACEIPKAGVTVAYVFDEGIIWRKEGERSPRKIVPRVKQSLMLEDRRQKVTAWRWEVELQTKRKIVRTRPVFTFLAVPTESGL